MRQLRLISLQLGIDVGRASKIVCLAAAIGAASSGVSFAENGDWSPTLGWMPNVARPQFYVEGAIGGGTSWFDSDREGGRRNVDWMSLAFHRDRDRDHGGSGVFGGGSFGMLFVQPGGWSFGLSAAVFGSNTEILVGRSETSAKFISALYTLNASIGYTFAPSTPNFRPNTQYYARLPVTISQGFGLGGATIGLRRDDESEQKSVFAWTAVTDLRVGITPQWAIGTKFVYFSTSTAEFDRRRFSMNGFIGMATASYTFEHRNF